MFNRKKNFRDQTATLTSDVSDLADRIRPLIDEHVRPLVETAIDSVRPVARDVKINTASTMHGLVGNTHLGTNDAPDHAASATEAVRQKLIEEFLPRLEDALRNAADLPIVEQTDEAIATFAERGGLTKKKHGGVNRFGLIAGTTGLLAGVIYSLRKFLRSPQENGWTAHEPSSAYVPREDFLADPDAETVTAGETVSEQTEPRRGFTDPDTAADFTSNDDEK